MKRINTSQSVMPQASLNARGWWYVLGCLPLAYLVQVACLLSLSREGAAMTQAALWVDAAIFLRSVIGLVWHPRRPDWPFYLGALFGCIPLIWGLYCLGALADKMGLL